MYIIMGVTLSIISNPMWIVCSDWLVTGRYGTAFRHWSHDAETKMISPRWKWGYGFCALYMYVRIAYVAPSAGSGALCAVQEVCSPHGRGNYRKRLNLTPGNTDKVNRKAANAFMVYLKGKGLYHSFETLPTTPGPRNYFRCL